MLLDLENLYKKYNMNIKGVIHIGGHFGEEQEIYDKLKIENVVYFEPTPDTFEILEAKMKKHSNVQVFNYALGNFNGKSEIYSEDANNGQSNSLLKPSLHLQQYPHIKFTEKKEIIVKKFYDFALDNDFNLDDYNFINIDVQGYELEVFKGFNGLLSYFDYIISEVNIGEVYENCAKLNELDDFLGSFDFKRGETHMTPFLWGDAFWIKK